MTIASLHEAAFSPFFLSLNKGSPDFYPFGARAVAGGQIDTTLSALAVRVGPQAAFLP